MLIKIRNTTGIFNCTFQFEVNNPINWYILEGKENTQGKERFIFDIDFYVGCHYKDELGNKYDGYLHKGIDLIEATEKPEEIEYFFIEEFELN